MQLSKLITRQQSYLFERYLSYHRNNFILPYRMEEDDPKIKYCNVAQCKVCRHKQLDQKPSFYSNLTNRKYEIEFSQNCKTNLVIYQISCRHQNCSLKYIGRTNHAINRRLALHRANIIAGTEGPAMLHHFTQIHKPSDMTIKAIEICSKFTIKERESFWISELNTSLSLIYISEPTRP